MTTLKKKVLINEHEAADMIGLKVGTMRIRRIRKQPPVYFKIGKRVMYDVEELQAYIESGRVMPDEIREL